MAMLKFKKGLWSKLPETKVEGTIYVTTDEKAMYVDISDSQRIRLGDIIRVNTFNELQPPFSNEAFYYVESSNALLKRVAVTGENNEVTYEWKQINGTQELQSALTALTDRVSSVEGKMTTAEGKITTLEGKMTTAEGKITTLEGNVKTNADDIDAAELRIKALEETVGTDDSGNTLGSRVSAIEGTIADHTSAISDLNDALSEHAETAEATYAKAADVYKKTETYTKTEVDSAIDADVLVEKNRAIAEEERLAGLISAAQGKANDAYTLAGQKATLADVAAVGYALATDVESDIATAKGEAIADAASKYATIKTVETLDGKVSKNTGDISNINTALESVVTKTELEGKGYATTTQVGTAKQEAIDAAATAAAGLYALKTDLSTTNEAVSAAQGRADAAYKLAEGKTTTAAVKDQIEAYGYATTGQVATAKQEAIAAAKTAGDEAYATKDIEETVAGHTSALNVLNGTGEGSVAEAKAAAKAAQDDIDAWKTAHAGDYTNTQIDTAVADAKKAGIDAGTQAETNRQNIASLTATVDKLDGDVNTDGSVKKQIKDATDAIKTELSAEIDADINAANAMTFKGTVGSESALTGIEVSGKVKIGDTYVVSEAFGNYQPGDFLIAKSLTEAEDANGYIAADDIDWNHVKSGYDASLDQRLTGADNKIKLSTGTGLAGTEIAFEVAKDENGKPASSAAVSVANNTVTVGMVWEDFE